MMKWLVLGVLVLCGARSAEGQSLLDALPPSEPTTFAYRLGPLQANPGLQIREIGVDTNVFDEPVNPKKDYVIGLTPTLGLYSRLGFTQFFGSIDTDLTYYHKYTSERSVSRSFRGRLNFDLSRLRPVLGAAYVESGDRPNAEIDLRARRKQTELNAQLGYEISPLVRVYAGAKRANTTYDDTEVFQAVNLDDVLSRRTESAEAGVYIAATPFTTVQVYAGTSRDKFAAAPLRDTDSSVGNVQVTFGTDAILRGTARVGFRSTNPVDPKVRDFKGLITSTTLSTTGFWRGRIDLTLNRDIDYSFEEQSGYFVATTVDLAYNQRIAGAWDFELRGSRTGMDYSSVEAEARQDVRLIYSAGVGYNLQSQSRIGFAYEYSERDSPERSDRRYTRRRVVGSWTYRF